MTVFVAYQVRGKIYLQTGGAKCLSRFKQVKGVFTMPRLSKKAKQEWDFHKSRNKQKNIQQPLSQMQKQMQAEPHGNRCFLPKVQIQKRCKKR